MKLSKWTGNRIQELHFGTLLLGKITFVMSVVSTITVLSIKFNVNLTPASLVVVGILSFLLTWGMGYLSEKYGIRKHFQNAQFKNTVVDRKDI